MASVYIGDPIPVVLQLGDRNTSAVVTARIFDAGGSEIPDSPCGLAAFDDGLYLYGGAFMPDTPFVSVQYIVYYGDGVTINETYPAVSEVFTLAVRPLTLAQMAAATLPVNVVKFKDKDIEGAGIPPAFDSEGNVTDPGDPWRFV